MLAGNRFLAAAAATALVLFGTSPALAGGTALDRYIHRPEPDATWKTTKAEVKGGLHHVELELVSQKWRDIVWKHHIVMVRPEKPTNPDLSLLVITGGDARKQAARYASILAREAGCTIAVLDSIPNQPLFGGLKEDDLIAHTFMKWYETGEDDWPVLFAMTKSAVKAMDAIQDYSEKEWGTKVDRFVTSGASKRGWTTWLTGAVDGRVAAIAPIVFDNLNFGPQMKHQIDWWGEYSEQIDEYTKRGLQKLITTEKGQKLLGLVDPYSYRDRYQKLPKLLINATNDRYWAMNAINFYWDGIGDNKWNLYVPNEGHGIKDYDRVLKTAAAFLRRVGAKKGMPELKWKFEKTGSTHLVRVSSAEAPVEVRVWVAKSAVRDFREAVWESKVADAASQQFVATIDEPAEGYTAFFVEAVYQEPGHAPFTISSTVKILGEKAAPARSTVPLTKGKAKLY